GHDRGDAALGAAPERRRAPGPRPAAREARVPAPAAAGSAHRASLAEIVDHPVDAPHRVSLEGREPFEHHPGIHADGTHSTSVPYPRRAFPRGWTRADARAFPNGTRRFTTNRSGQVRLRVA